MSDLDEYYRQMNGVMPEGCTCIVHRGPTFSEWNGPQPAEVEPDYDCPVHFPTTDASDDRH